MSALKMLFLPICFVVCIFGTQTMNAQDIIIKKDLTIIRAHIEEIGDESIVYKDANNPDGPNYRISIVNVATVKLADGTELKFGDSMKSGNNGKTSTVEDNKLGLDYTWWGKPYLYQYSSYSVGDKLTEFEASQLLGMEKYEEFLTASELYPIPKTLSSVLVYIGGGVLMYGLIPGLYDSDWSILKESWPGAAALIAGSWLIDLLWTSQYTRRMKRVVDDYNNGVRLSFNISPALLGDNSVACAHITPGISFKVVF